MNRAPQPYSQGDLAVVIGCRDLDRSARFWSATPLTRDPVAEHGWT